MGRFLSFLFVLFVLAVSNLCFASSPFPSAVVEHVCSSTAFVSTYLKESPQGTGSGVVIYNGPDYTLLITCNHVVKECDSWTASFGQDDRVWPCTVDKTAVMKYGDLALLRIHAALPLAAIPLAATTPRRGEPIFACGCPYGLRDLVAYGHVAGFTPRTFDKDPATFLMMNISVEPGMSGGPVCNEFGQIVGLAKALYPEGTLCYSTTVDNIRAFLGWKP